MIQQSGQTRLGQATQRKEREIDGKWTNAKGDTIWKTEERNFMKKKLIEK